MSGQREAQLGIIGFDPNMAKPKFRAQMSQPPNILFLRPLGSTRRVMIKNRFPLYANPSLMRFPFEPTRVTLEGALHRAMFCFSGSTVGGPVDGLGMARLMLANPDSSITDTALTDAWKKPVLVALESAELILVLASPTDGVSWEVGELKARERLECSVIVMTPKEADGYGEREWHQAAARYVDRGVHIGPYAPSGGFVFLHKDGTRRVMLEFESLWNGELLRAVLPAVIEALTRALATAEAANQVEKQIFKLCKLGCCFRVTGLTDKSLECYQRAATLCAQIGATELEACSLADVGFIHALLRNAEQARSFYARSLAAFRATGHGVDSVEVTTLESRLGSLSSA